MAKKLDVKKEAELARYKKGDKRGKGDKKGKGKSKKQGDDNTAYKDIIEDSQDINIVE